MPRHPNLPAARRHSGGPAAVQRRPLDRREELPRALARRHGGGRHLRHHHQRAFDRGRLVHLRRAAARARDRAGRGRRARPDRQRRVGRRQPGGRHGSPAWRKPAAPPRCSCSRRRRSRSANRPPWRSRISGTSPTPPTCRSSCSSIRSAPARVIRATRCCALPTQVPTVRAIKDWCNNVPQHEMQIRAAAGPEAARERAVDAQFLAVLLAGARLQRAPVGLRQRDRRPAGGAVPRRAGQRSRRGAPHQRPHLSDSRACSIASRGPTCTTG